MKKCTKCSVVKPLEEFGPRKLIRKMGTTSHCTACRSEANKKCRLASSKQYSERKKEWYLKDKALHPNKGKDKALKRKYGITYLQKEEMWLKQNKMCAICSKSLDTLWAAKTDHNHSTGKVRQLLCSPCNEYLGIIKEDFSTALKLAKYIQDHNGVI